MFERLVKLMRFSYVQHALVGGCFSVPPTTPDAPTCPALASSGPVCPEIALLLAHCLAARPLPPAYGLGDGAKSPENRQNLPVDALHQLWQDGPGMNESEKQFSFTRATPSTSGRAKNQIPISRKKRIPISISQGSNWT
jgi:hypothetical protein